MQYKLVERECVPYELSKEEYDECVKLIKKIRLKEFSDALDRAVKVLGVELVAAKIKKENILQFVKWEF